MSRRKGIPNRRVFRVGQKVQTPPSGKEGILVRNLLGRNNAVLFEDGTRKEFLDRELRRKGKDREKTK